MASTSSATSKRCGSVRARKRGGRALAAAVVGAGLFLGIAPAAHATTPINPNNRPTPMPGTNGALPPQELVRVAPACIAARPAGPSIARLFAIAREHDVALGPEECYRTLAEEVQLANEANQPGQNPACVASVSRGANGAPIGNSYHGWGKAVDLAYAGQELTFSSPGYFFMKQYAASLGWNHPAFAEPGGSACPEPWHWEWVGDGGSLHLSSIRADAVGLLPSAGGHGYATVTGLGALAPHGDFASHGDASNLPIAWVMSGAAATPDRGGYWMVGSDGGVFTFGDAHFHGSAGALPLAAPVNGIAPTRDGNGYWLSAWDGGVFSYGDARFEGSMGGQALVAPVDGIASAKTGSGYWLVASDGGVFTFGSARFHGSMGGHVLNQPIVAMAATPSGNGYWLLGSDGGVFTFGDAHFYGSTGGAPPSSPAVAMVPTSTGHGYWLEFADATVVPFGDAGNFGSG